MMLEMQKKMVEWNIWKSLNKGLKMKNSWITQWGLRNLKKKRNMGEGDPCNTTKAFNFWIIWLKGQHHGEGIDHNFLRIKKRF